MQLTNIILNPATACFISIIWCITILSISSFSGIFEGYMRFGPNPELFLFGKNINSWVEWSLIVTYIIINRVVQVYTGEITYPWILNVIQDPKISVGQKKLDIGQCVFLTVVYYSYIFISSIFSIQIALTQLDLICVSLLAEVISAMVTTSFYCHRKNIAILNSSPSYFLPEK